MTKKEMTKHEILERFKAWRAVEAIQWKAMMVDPDTKPAERDKARARLGELYPTIECGLNPLRYKAFRDTLETSSST